jgi:phosphatidylglycerol---prolipoprotein diacylglyceryl transferase
VIWDVDREIVSFGPIALRWYSMLFALGIILGYLIVQEMFKKEGKSQALLDSLLFHVVVGTVVGARLGHCLLYEPGEYLQDPIRILKIWEGGLASHGGFTGVIIALILFCRKNPEIKFFWLADRMTVPCMLTAGFIRIGNFFNSEIIGHAADVPWAIVFKKVDLVPRHPSQIYEAIGYLTIALIQYVAYRVSHRHPKEGSLFGLALILGFGFRLYIERFKENQVAFEDGMLLNMGQLLSVPFILAGILFLLGIHRKIGFFRGALSAEATPTGAAAGPADAPGLPRHGKKKHK